MAMGVAWVYDPRAFIAISQRGSTWTVHPGRGSRQNNSTFGPGDQHQPPLVHVLSLDPLHYLASTVQRQIARAENGPYSLASSQLGEPHEDEYDHQYDNGLDAP